MFKPNRRIGEDGTEAKVYICRYSGWAFRRRNKSIKRGYTAAADHEEPDRQFSNILPGGRGLKRKKKPIKTAERLSTHAVLRNLYPPGDWAGGYAAVLETERAGLSDYRRYVYGKISAGIFGHRIRRAAEPEGLRQNNEKRAE